MQHFFYFSVSLPPFLKKSPLLGKILLRMAHILDFKNGYHLKSCVLLRCLREVILFACVKHEKHKG